MKPNRACQHDCHHRNLATYIVVAVGRVPGLRLDRAGAALIGAALMVVTGSLSAEDAYRAIDLDTLALLLGMMIVVANLRLAAVALTWRNRMHRIAAAPVLLADERLGRGDGASPLLAPDRDRSKGRRPGWSRV